MSQPILNKNGLTEAEFLAQYDADKYPRPSMAVDMLIFSIMSEQEQNYRKLPQKQLQVLMIKRGDHPCIGQWALPGGFVNIDESLDEAAKRELKEETGVETRYLEQLHTWGDVDRDPRTRVISCSYLSLVDSEARQAKAGDDADDAVWYSVAEEVLAHEKTADEQGYAINKVIELKLESDKEHLQARIRWSKEVRGKQFQDQLEVSDSQGIAFDHAKLITVGLERLRRKLYSSDVVFQLMPETFTLTELQQVYEVILGEKLLKANFRRKVAPLVVKTDGVRKAAGHRPSQLYRFNYRWIEEDHWPIGGGNLK